MPRELDFVFGGRQWARDMQFGEHLNLKEVTWSAQPLREHFLKEAKQEEEGSDVKVETRGWHVGCFKEWC